jgi:anti-sigma B factor antagonist
MVSCLVVSRVPTVSAVGEVDLATAPQLVEALASALANNPPSVVLDLGGVTFLDSSGLAAMVQSNKQCRALGGRLRLSNIPYRIEQLLKVSGLESFLDRHDSDIPVLKVTPGGVGHKVRTGEEQASRNLEVDPPA